LFPPPIRNSTGPSFNTCVPEKYIRFVINLLRLNISTWNPGSVFRNL
jgi:hypothetical protein